MPYNKSKSTWGEITPSFLANTNLASIPVDIARGDYVSAGLSAVGMIPVAGEIADTAKIAKVADEAVDAAKAVDKVADAVKAADKAADAAKTLDVAKFPKTLHSGRQGKYIVGHNNYKNGRSVFSGSISDAQQLMEKYSGTGHRINSTSERVNFERVIGKYVDKRTGKAYDTTVGTIRYSKEGAHIVPARPINWRE